MRVLGSLLLFVLLPLRAELILPDDLDRFSNDELSVYQWGLRNQGHIIVRDIDDLHQVFVRGVQGVDIGFPNEKLIFKRDVVVALIDSGVDYEHPDLRDNIAYNLAECDVNGDKVNFQFLTREDRDGNGFAGDCKGWNFTGEGQGDHLADDQIGHGTMMAGVISSVSANGIGLAGLSNRIKILPLKVVADYVEDSQQPFFDRVRRALAYAISRKVDVINMSFGWPLYVHDHKIEALLGQASKQGIALVAATANDSHKALIYPCHLLDVICVAAHGVRGELAPFSNFGAGVDLAAPGEEILSTFPTLKLPTFFEAYTGYDLYGDGGSSQAAAYVSSAIAALKGVLGVSTDEAYARLRLSAKSLRSDAQKKSISGGRIHLASALAQRKQSAVLPEFKGVRHLELDPQSRQAELVVTIKNYWHQARDVKVQLRSLTPGMSLNKDFVVPLLAAGQRKTLQASLQVDHLDREHLFHYEVRISVQGESRVYRDELMLLSLKKPSFQLSLPGLNSQNDVFFRRVADPHFYFSSARYFLLEPHPQGLQLALYQLSGTNKTIYTRKVRVFKNLRFDLRMISLTAVDLNGDDRADYILRAVSQAGKPAPVDVLLNEELEDLFGSEKSVWYWDSEYLQRNSRGRLNQLLHYGGRVAWLNYQGPHFPAVKVPVVLENAMIPQSQRRSSALEAEDKSSKSRFYIFLPFFEKGKTYLRPRLLFTKPQMAQARKSLGLRWEDSLEAFSMLHQSRDDLRTNHLYLFFRAVTSHTQKLYRMSLRDRREDLQLSDSPLQFYGEVHSPRFKFELNRRRPSEPLFEFFANSFKGQWCQLSREGAVSAPFHQPDNSDPFQALSTVIKTPAGYAALFESQRHLVLHNYNKQGELLSTDKKALYRSSHLPGSFFTEIFYPFLNSDKEASLSYYVDTTTLRSPAVYVHKVSQGRLRSPLRSTIKVPPHCDKTFLPVLLRNRRYASFLCREGDSENVGLNLYEI